jgi:hypothetical protein
MSAGIAWKMHLGNDEKVATMKEIAYRVGLALRADTVVFRSCYPFPCLGL